MNEIAWFDSILHLSKDVGDAEVFWIEWKRGLETKSLIHRSLQVWLCLSPSTMHSTVHAMATLDVGSMMCQRRLTLAHYWTNFFCAKSHHCIRIASTSCSYLCTGSGQTSLAVVCITSFIYTSFIYTLFKMSSRVIAGYVSIRNMTMTCSWLSKWSAIKSYIMYIEVFFEINYNSYPNYRHSHPRKYIGLLYGLWQWLNFRFRHCVPSVWTTCARPIT